MIVLVYPKCSTCKKALNWLDEHGISYIQRDFVKDHPTYTELKGWIQKSGLPIKRFFNTSGNVYKEQNLKTKLLSLSEEEQILLLSENGMLVKRPLLIDDEFVLVGFLVSEFEKAFDK